MRAALAAVACAGVLLAGKSAPAHPDDELPELPLDQPALPADDPSFGPLLEIEAIEIEGNQWSADRVILRALPVRPGDVLRPGDPRLQKARFKLLALGFFRTVDLTFRRGTVRGKVILVVAVEERGTVILNQLHFGISSATPGWVGADVTERNFLGTGVGLGAGAVWAADGDIAGQRAQWATEARFADESVLGTTVGVHAGFYRRASEPFRVSGGEDDDGAEHFQAFPYSRTGGAAGVSFAATPLSRFAADVRFEHVRASPPAMPTRELPGGEVVNVNLHLPAGKSRLVALAIGFDRDTRADPVLPFGGDRLVMLVQASAEGAGSSWDFLSAFARYGKWWPVVSLANVVSVHVQAGAIFGDAPQFERLYAGDFDRWRTPRALGLVVSTQSGADLFGTGAEDVVYGELAGSVAVEYSRRMFRRHKHIYGGDFFVGGGLWTMGERTDDLAIDAFLDVGMRLDTEIGIFELTLANALGRVPF